MAAAVTASAAVHGKLSAASARRAAVASGMSGCRVRRQPVLRSRSDVLAVRDAQGVEAAEALLRSSARDRSAPHATRSWLSARASRAMTSPGSVVVAPRVVTSSSGFSAYPRSASGAGLQFPHDLLTALLSLPG